MKRLILPALALLLTGAGPPASAQPPAPVEIGISGRVHLAGGGPNPRAWGNTKSRRAAARPGDARRVKLCFVPPNGNATKGELPRRTQRQRSTCATKSIDRLN